MLKDESGYSLVEVVVAIMLLSLAIIPMVGMFDAGLRAAVLGSNYDQARAIANEELEEIKALPYSSPDDPALGTLNSMVEIYEPNGDPNATPKNCTSPVPAEFTCKVKATYVRNDFSTASIVPDPSARTMAQTVVTVTWNGGGPYTTTGFVSKETRCAIEAEC